ncbi:DUF2663 family protein [Bacillus sp. JCM 19034]|uniref:DUF2663 family protein n=1 Tax=Bacillus sp. JCM 19034 TaxID=1481928 RepID=UPI000782D423|nr:DUF2663 family protein [Bacillus sp. JCM 19034]
MKNVTDWSIEDYQASPVIKIMLKELIERKSKVEKWKNYQTYCGYGTCFLLLLLLAISYFTFSQPAFSFHYSILTQLTDETLFIFALLLIGFNLLLLQYFHKKTIKTEKEYEELREELIDRNSELWEEDTGWQAREHVFQYLKTNHDINLYFK